MDRSIINPNYTNPIGLTQLLLLKPKLCYCLGYFDPFPLQVLLDSPAILCPIECSTLV